ncbi:snoRNA-binding rRNA-processing protein utp10 [Pichia californica]|uniref:U3 small nucleolar RNA-associated protein 10 n=1 Tax=Pichia californica TaxID=460514 RepID=A0A9P6WPS2_9ASCO|nr:snoRNA-binding rRNA-processing protein utp10 [[Candida] californica]KAG0690037.1 snoRNA-binding rRNA-processing protein utp10 [[Candida] californica]
MTSLAEQLAGIAQQSKAVALDRKRRTKIHSVSLLHDSKIAATQDYETIFYDSLDALHRLQTIDHRFVKFENSIFSETSIQIDRQIQSKEENDNLNKTINAFLSLISPYWHLAITVRAAEWPLRRFQMNIYNSEHLLLSTLPYFDQPIFPHILYIIPDLPKLFSWLQNFKKSNTNPSKNTIIKAFTDVDFFNLYSKYSQDEIRHKNQFRKFLIFYVSMTISSLATLSSSNSEKLKTFIPYSLECVSSLLSANDDESKISAYTILVVISAAVPLSREIVIASVETVLMSSSSVNSSENLKESSFNCAIKLLQSIQDQGLEPLPNKIINLLPTELLTDSSLPYLEIISILPNNGKFICTYLRALIKNNFAITSKILTNIKNANVSFTKQQFSLITSELLKSIIDNSNTNNYIDLLKYLVKENKDCFLDTLSTLDIKLSDLEIMVQSTLVDQNNESQLEEESDVIVQLNTAPVDLHDEFLENITDVQSFLSNNLDVDSKYEVLENLYLKSLLDKSSDDFINTCLVKPSVIISFLLRVATSNTPIKARLQSIQSLITQINSLDSSVYICPILPIIITLLINPNQLIRKTACDLITAIDIKSSKSTADSILLADVLYGSNTSEVAVISPKDAKSLLSALVKNIPNFIIDDSSLFPCLESILTNKKLGKLYLAFFTTHALYVGIPIIKMNLINISVQSAKNVKGAASPSTLFENLLYSYVSKRDEWIIKCTKTNCNSVDFESTIVSLVSTKEKNEVAITFLESALASPYEQLSNLAIDQIVKILPTLKFDFQIKIVNYILEEYLADNVVTYDPVDVLESIDITNSIFVELLKSSTLNTETTPQAQSNPPKRRRRSSQSTRQAMKDDEVSTMATSHLKKITMLLEVLDHFSKKFDFEPSFELLKLIFIVLDDLETLGKDGKLPILYAQETIASCLKNIIEKLKEMNVPIKDASLIRADVIVSAIRASDSPQVQNKLLLVIAALASLSPELVLHSLMPIFTFMGAHTIRQDDEFSGHVVEQTIICVVPALANAAQYGKIDEIEFLLASFVSAFLHVPRHRRVRLFTTLARTLGSDLSIHLILFLCGQQYVNAYMKHRMGDCSALVDFATVFLQVFTAKEELDATRRFLDLWKCIPKEPVEKDSAAFKELSSKVIFGPSIVSMSKNELYHWRKGLVSFIRHALTDSQGSNGIPKLRLKIASQILDERNTPELLSSFSETIKYLLDVIDMLSNSHEDEEIMSKFYKLLGDVLNLLPIEYYCKSVDDILRSPETSLQTTKSLVTLTASKFNLEHTENSYAHEGIALLMPTLSEKISSQTDIELSQACLDTMATIFHRFGEHIESSSLIKFLSIIIGKCGLVNGNSPELTISSINCITSIVVIVGVKMIGLFPRIVPPVLKIFDESVGSKQESSKLIQISIIVFFSTLIKKIPNFLTPNIKGILKALFRANSVSESIRSNVLDVMVEYIDSKIIISSLCSLWSFVSTLNATSLGLFIGTMENTVEKMNKSTAISESTLFFKFLTNALEYRAVSTFDSNTVGRVESMIHNCGIVYVMKLNDKSFRPLLALIVRWAFDGEGVVTDINETERLESFFKFFNRLQENLRAIVTTYYNYILNSTVVLLERFASGDLVSVSLRRLVIISLTSSFKYDQTEYWQVGSRFDLISQGLTSQLSNIEDSIGKHLVKALCALAQDTSSSDDHNKRLNELLISHMRAIGEVEPTSREKYWSVKAITIIYKRVGEAWLSLLPQLVPIVAELLEDDDDDVQTAVREGLAKIMEELMGESLEHLLA